jgi:uncharacterized protein
MSRLTTLRPGLQADTSQFASLNFRDMGGWHLISNDWGHFLMLETPDFEAFMRGEIGPDHTLYPELEKRGFLRDRLDFEDLARSHGKRTAFQHFNGPSLHMIVVTLRCNLGCTYCHSSVVDPSRTDTDMDLETARRTVDFIFDTPNQTICIEFQGGEPLLNWPVVKFITKYAQRKAKGTGRRLIVSLVSNFNLMTEDKLEFLIEHSVSICTSLDGPEDLHNFNRPRLGGGASQPLVVKWLKDIVKRCDENPSRRYYYPGALMTTTRASLSRGKDIVDLYRSLNMEQVFLRPLSPIGYAKRVWNEIGYTPAEFAKFYEDTLDYIIDLNLKGEKIMERMAVVVLTKLMKGEDPGFMDMRSPAGAVIGCVAYNYNGDIHVSDEGRMVSHQGDEIFRIGNVFKNKWKDVVDHPTARSCTAASVLDGQPLCMQCTYKAYCGAEPVFHYEMQRNIAGQMTNSNWCKGHMGIFDVIFKKMRDPKVRAVFEKWMETDSCKWEESQYMLEPGQPHPGDDTDDEPESAAVVPSKNGKGKK